MGCWVSGAQWLGLKNMGETITPEFFLPRFREKRIQTFSFSWEHVSHMLCLAWLSTAVNFDVLSTHGIWYPDGLCCWYLRYFLFLCFLRQMPFPLTSLIMSSIQPHYSSSGETVGALSSEVPLVRCPGGSSTRVRPVEDASSSSSQHLDFPRRQRSQYTAGDEKVLRHNYDIPPSISLHFPDRSIGMLNGTSNIRVYEHMFMAGVRQPFSPFVRELLAFLGIAPG